MGILIDPQILKKTKELRRKLHKCPELAFHETQTKETLLNFLHEETTLEVVNCDTWFYAKKSGSGLKAPIAIRADFDAVEGADGCAGHYCGHDGHSSILAGTACLLSGIDTDRDVYLIFQPAEEIGKGAAICSSIIEEKGISAVYGFHNIPGQPLGTVLLRRGTFACASTGLEIHFKGSPAHAAYPEAGNNPADVIARLLLYTEERAKEPAKGMILATVIGVELGSKAYGVSASEGTVRFTLRGEIEEEFDALVKDVCGKAEALASEQNLEIDWHEIERFPATENYLNHVEIIGSAAERAGIPVTDLPHPFRWSEDFGYYLQKTEGAMFGVGSGKEHAQLHTKDYEFPDDIIEVLMKVYMKIAGN